MTPYNDTEHKSGSFVRIFSEDVDEMELHWHRDRNDRTFTVEAGVGWKFQIDDYLPIDLVQGKSYFIVRQRSSPFRLVRISFIVCGVVQIS